MLDGGGGAGDDFGWGEVGDGKGKRKGVSFEVVLGLVEVVLADKQGVVLVESGVR